MPQVLCADISLKGAFATFFFFLIILSVGNLLVENYCYIDSVRSTGRIFVRFMSCLALILICIQYFKIQLSKQKNLSIVTGTVLLSLSCLLGLVLFIFLLTEDVVELLIFSQYDVITAREIWASKIKIDRPGLNLDFQLVFGLLVACFATPLAEEIFFRALLFEALRLHFKTWVSVLFLAALFVAAHPQNPYVIGTLIFSITLSMVYLKLNSLWPCIIAHGFFNFLSFAYDNFSEIFLTPVLEEAYLISNWKLTLFLFFVSTSILVWIFCFSCRSHNRNNSAI